MKKLIENILGMIIGIIFLVFIFLVFITPEKDKFGNYTSSSKYWTSDEYFCSHFNISGNYCERR